MRKESISKCSQCGAPLPQNAPEGLCPRCLLSGAAATDALSRPQIAPAPPLETVAAAFPALEVIELIGQGGMGCVFKARQPQLNRFVALKILPEALARDPAFAARFAREAQALAALNHPNIVTVHDFGQSNGFFFLLMEFVDGVNLRQALRGGKFTPDQALAIVPPICDALHFAHQRGIVHRDIKPENLLLDKDGRIKIADFGIAKMLDQTATSDAAAVQQSAAGTPRYMAPEQRSEPASADHRADIYSLGVVLYELLTGEPPGTKLLPPSARVQIDVRLDEVVLRALESEPDRRYATADEFKTALVTALPQNANSPRETPTPAAAAARQSSDPLVENSSRSRRFAWIALGLFLCATLGTLLLMTISFRHGYALVFGATALALASGFGLAGRRDRLGKVVAMLSLGIPGIALLFLLVFLVSYQLIEKPRAVAHAEARQQQAREDLAATREKARALREARALDDAQKSKTNTASALLPREVVEQWLGHVKSNRVEEMWSLTTRESGGAGSVNLRDTWQFDRIKPYTLALAGNTAMVVTTPYRDNAGRDRQIAFTLVHRDGRWLIRDHWTNTPDIIEGRLDGFVTGSGARFDVRPTDIIGRWYTIAFLSASYEFHENGDFSTSYRTIGGRTNLTGTWTLRDDLLTYKTSGGENTGRVIHPREDFFQLLFEDDSLIGFQRIQERPTTGQGTPQFEPVQGHTLKTNEFLNFRSRQVQATRPEDGSVRLLPENGRLYIEIEEMHAFVLRGQKGVDQWNNKSAAELVQDYASSGFGLLPSERYSKIEVFPGELPLTFLLPGSGFLQVTELNPDASAVKIRYKLVAP